VVFGTALGIYRRYEKGLEPSMYIYLTPAQYSHTAAYYALLKFCSGIVVNELYNIYIKRINA